MRRAKMHSPGRLDVQGCMSMLDMSSLFFTRSQIQRYATTGIALCLVSLSACDKKKKEPKKQEPAAQAKKPPAPAKKAETPKPPAAPPKLMQLAQPEAKFASRLFGLVAKDQKPGSNFVISPMSVYVAMSMTRLGAKEATATTLNGVLALPADATSQSIATSLGRSQRMWTQSRPGSELAIANRLFADESFKIQPGFVEMTQASLGAGIQNLAFARQTDAARKTINDWVAGQTKNRIKNLLGPGNVTTNTKLVLVNAIWFKGEWAHQFKPKATKARPFHLASKKRIKVATMTMSHDFPVLEVKSQGYRAIDMPYADGKLAMSIILPNKGQSLAELEATLDLATLSQGLNKAMPRKVSLQLPKFTIDPSNSISLRPQLTSMGAGTIFGSPTPNFTAMAHASEKLAVQDVVHKAMIIVDEKGAEAAAATAVTTYRSAAIPQTYDFHVNRPFMFMIRDKQDGSILFAGQVAHPTP